MNTGAQNEPAPPEGVTGVGWGRKWRQRGGYAAPDRVRDAWRRAGFTAAEAVDWIRYGFSPATAARWRARDFAPLEARAWAVTGLSPANAEVLAREGFTSQSAQEWLADD